jgi:hypothetical protein
MTQTGNSPWSGSALNTACQTARQMQQEPTFLWHASYLDCKEVSLLLRAKRILPVWQTTGCFQCLCMPHWLQPTYKGLSPKQVPKEQELPMKTSPTCCLDFALFGHARRTSERWWCADTHSTKYHAGARPPSRLALQELSPPLVGAARGRHIAGQLRRPPGGGLEGAWVLRTIQPGKPPSYLL